MVEMGYDNCTCHFCKNRQLMVSDKTCNVRQELIKRPGTLAQLRAGRYLHCECHRNNGLQDACEVECKACHRNKKIVSENFIIPEKTFQAKKKESFDKFGPKRSTTPPVVKEKSSVEKVEKEPEKEKEVDKKDVKESKKVEEKTGKEDKDEKTKAT